MNTQSKLTFALSYSLLHSGSVELVWNNVWTLVSLVQDPELSNDIRFQGGIPLFLSLLQDCFTSDKETLPSLDDSEYTESVGCIKVMKLMPV